MSKTLTELRACKRIVEVTPLDIQEIATATLPAYQAAADTVYLYRIVYKVGALRVVGYVAIPKRSKNLPCLLHLRGGGGDFQRLQPKSLLVHLVRYAQNGYVVTAPQYPGAEGGDGVDAYGGPDDLKSITVLRDILKDLTVADHTRIGLKGHSRGGLMVYLLLREVSWVKAAVIGGAPTDQVRQAKTRPGWRAHQIKLWGRSREENIRRSPLRWVDDLPTRVPILLMHGAADWRVDPLDSLDMSRALFARQIPHRLLLFEGADHGISEYRSEYIRQTREWFDRFLKQGESLPDSRPHGD